MNANGADIPTAWLLLVPIVNLWWLWCYAEGADDATDDRLSAPFVFIAMWVLNGFAPLIIQYAFNQAGAIRAQTVEELFD